MKPKVILLLTLLPVLSISGIAFAQTTDTEEITLSTYYPAPYGEYDELFSERLLVWRPDADEMVDMNEGDCHIGWSMVVGAGGTGFSYDELQAAGTLPGDGVVLIKDSLGIGTTNPRSKLEIDQLNTGYGLHLDLVDAYQDAFILQNAYYSSGWIDGALQLRWPMAHGFFGSRGIMMSAIQDTGGIIFFADSVATVVNAAFTPTERMRITNSGNVGIGATTPVSRLQVDLGNNAPTGTIDEMADLTGYSVVLSDTTSALDSKVGLYSATAGGGTGLGAGFVFGREGASWGTYVAVHTHPNDAVDIDAFPERMRINSDGYVGIGVTSPSYRLQLPNIANASGRGQANQWDTYSSRRWKDDISPIQNALDKVCKLQGVRFNWKQEYGGKAGIGFIAEDVGEVLPELVDYEENGIDARGLAYDQITAVLVEAIKELKTENEALRQEIKQLKKAMGK